MNSNESVIYGGFFRRLLALMIDALILVIPCMVAAHIIPFVGAIAVAIMYYPVFDSSPVQATPGRFIMGLRVTQENGQQLIFSRALVRHLMSYVSGLLFCLGYLMQLFTDKRQTLHDIVAGAIVLRENRTQTPNWIQVWLDQMKKLMAFDESRKLATVSGASTETHHDKTTTEKPTRDEAFNQIQKLQDLLKSGALTEEEFQAQKSQILQDLLKS